MSNLLPSKINYLDLKKVEKQQENGENVEWKYSNEKGF